MCFFFFNDTATTEIYTLSLHDALPICLLPTGHDSPASCLPHAAQRSRHARRLSSNASDGRRRCRSEEHTSELQSRQYLVCRLLLEKKKKWRKAHRPTNISSRRQNSTTR